VTIHFDSALPKYTEDGAFVLSTTLEEGETLANGLTYAEVKENGSIPGDLSEKQFRQLTNNENATTPALTLDDSGTSGVPETLASGGTPTQDEDVPASEETATAADDAAEPKGETAEEEVPARPKDTASKSEWFEYAKTFGYEGTEEENTKQFYIDNYGN
jgi:hypothetical protein